MDKQVKSEPEFLILDEPMNGLDPDGIFTLKELLKKKKEDGVTILISSQLMAGLAHTISFAVVIVIVTFIAGSILGGVGDLRYPLDINPIFGSDQEILSLKDYFLQSIPLWLCSIFFMYQLLFWFLRYV